MKRGKLLNAELNKAIASLGHTDYMIVCDAGFPIPNDAWRIDLSIVPDVPDLETVLTAISHDFIAMKVSYAEDMVKHNKPLLEKVKRIFPASEHAPISQDKMLTEMGANAKCIVRTGAFDPWGNVVLYSGGDYPLWFAKPGVTVPKEYIEVVERMRRDQASE